MSELQVQRIHDIVKVLREKDRFLIATHIHPDGDALGSLLSLVSMLRRMGKTAQGFAQDPAPPGYEFLSGINEIQNTAPQSSRFDVAILVDCGDYFRVGDALGASIKDIPHLINIDHHISSAPFGDVYWVETRASSTCEMLYELSTYLPLDLDPEIATHLYTGLMTDTGSFRFANTNGRVLEIAGKLVAAGARPAQIAQEVFDSATPQRLQLLARVLSTVSFHEQNRLATAFLSLDMIRETGASSQESDGFINQIRSVKSVEIAIFLKEGSDGVIHVSMRSKGNVDVATLAQRHGGGGHRNAAACRIAGPLDLVRSKITTEALGYLS